MMIKPKILFISSFFCFFSLAFSWLLRDELDGEELSEVSGPESALSKTHVEGPVFKVGLPNEDWSGPTATY